MIDNLPNHWGALTLAVVALGLRHGMDADHLAAIDGFTRCTAVSRPRQSRWCGILFSAGHGVVVIAMTMIVATVAQHWDAPPWLEDFGAWLSISCLCVLGVINIHNALRVSSTDAATFVGIKGRWLGPLSRAQHPLMIASVGALFAISFDTMSQVALFAAAAATMAGWGFALALGVGFTLGMIVIDGANGLWVARLLRTADRRATVTARAMGFVVGGVSLLIGALAVVRQLLPDLALRFEDGSESMMGVGVCVVVTAACLFIVMFHKSSPSVERMQYRDGGDD